MQGSADLVLRGGTLFTGAAPASALAVRSGRIVAIGSDSEVRPLIGSSTRVLDVAGCTVLPGFQDAHIHAPSAGLSMSRCDLSAAHDARAYVALVQEYAESHPEALWVLGDGWSLDAFPDGLPHRSLLDRVVPDRPVYLENRDGHGAWVNGRALELAGITRTTPDPSDGRIERDAGGEAIGVLQEGAMDVVAALAPPTSTDEWKEAILRAQRYLHSLGITAWQDAHVESRQVEAYRALAEEGALTARVRGALWWKREEGEEQIADLVELRAMGSAGRLRCGSVKIMQDGIVENFTAGLTSPYLDPTGAKTEREGLSFVEPRALGKVVTRLDSEGFQVHFHAIGDRAARECLDAVEEAARANGPSPNRHHIAHLQVVHPRDVPRFRALGVAANVQPFWACLDGQMEHLNLPMLGPERARWQYPFESLRRSGAVLAMGSDWQVSTPDPLQEIEVATTRRPVTNRAAEPFLPAERLSLPDALIAFTAGSAFVNHLDDATGTLEVGKMADLAVIDRDLFTADGAPIGEARVVLTLVEGEAVFADPSIAW